MKAILSAITFRCALNPNSAVKLARLGGPGENTPLACGFRRRAENFVPPNYSPPPRPFDWGHESSGATPELTRGTRVLPIPISVKTRMHR